VEFYRMVSGLWEATEESDRENAPRALGRGVVAQGSGLILKESKK